MARLGSERWRSLLQEAALDREMSCWRFVPSPDTSHFASFLDVFQRDLLEKSFNILTEGRRMVNLEVPLDARLEHSSIASAVRAFQLHF